ncbi:IS5 family transposase [Roseicitreum antarcticum]|jgi:IS5 family transposase|uniref:Transposase, IS5 family n=1 Tax=Roseicitreum antarcticum TaxID=564137 RepID=A0A1H3EGD5_9RHOB|nr:IS5 family transposase [Roseicitreum antarcticum]SDX76989.1 transposase, IS5 family [Roseicitreum antarcticum]
MKPKTRSTEQDDLLRVRARLIEMIDMRHELVKLAALIDWDIFEREWAGFFPSHTGRPATSPRLVAGLLYLQHAFALSDEAVVARWAENPYWQHFCGETFFQHRLPIDPSSMTRWRKRIGEEGVEWMLTQTIESGKRAGAVKGNDLKRVTVDTTVMEKNIAHPTDARLYETARRKLVGLAREAGIGLRQNYNRLAPRLPGQVGRYAHARQFKRMRKALRRLKGYTGRVLRDVERQLDQIPEGVLKARIVEIIALVNRLLAQEPKDKNKLYSLHEPAVDCISKGKAHKRYEFGTKVSVATANRGGFVVGMRALPGNPYDGHTLSEALEQVEILTDQKPEFAFVDRGYRGHGVQNVKVFISGAKRGVTRTIARLLRRRSAIEPMIGHMKNDGRLTRSTLKGTEGDTVFAVLCGCGHNIRMILRYLRIILHQLIWLIRPACMIVDAKMVYGRTDQAAKIAT